MYYDKRFVKMSNTSQISIRWYAKDMYFKHLAC